MRETTVARYTHTHMVCAAVCTCTCVHIQMYLDTRVREPGTSMKNNNQPHSSETDFLCWG